MIGYGRQLIGLAVALASLAGFVDALGFITLGGFFVSFMSGNSTRFSVGLAEGSWSHAGIALSILILFILGVMLGSVIAYFTDHNRRTRKTAVLATVSALLLVAALANDLGARPVAITAMILAMGAENGVFQRHGEVSIALTYMTGALVKIGQRLAGAFLGGPRWSWVPYLGLWTGLCTGAVTGALAHRAFGLDALWIAAAIAVALTAAVRTLPLHP